MNRLFSLIRRNFEALILSAAALALYLSFMSRSFDEWDAFNFGLALTRYDVSAHRPHPPGYPVFVFISSIIYRLTNDPLLSLTIVSAVSGALTLIAAYSIARQLFDREVAFLSALALMIAPAFWLTSEQAVSDMLFTLFLTVAMCLLLVGRKSKPHLYASWGFLGIALGVRPFNAVFIAPFLLETIRQRQRRQALGCFAVFFATIAIAFLPAVLLTGYSGYVNSTLRQLAGHLQNDVISARGLGLSEIERLGFLALTLVTSGFGANLPFRIVPFYKFVSNSFTAPINLALVLIFSAAGLYVFRRKTGSPKALFVALWVAPYFLMVYLLGTPEYARYLLPIIPPLMMLLVASGLRGFRALPSLAERESSYLASLTMVARYGLVLLFVTGMFAYSLPLAISLHTEEAPNIQLVAYVRANYDPATTTIVAFHEMRAFQFFGGEFRYVHCCHDVRKVLGVIESYSDSSDPILITSSAVIALLAKGVRLKVLKLAEFSRDPLVVVEDHKVVLYLLLSIA